MRRATKANLEEACRKCHAPPGEACKIPSPAWYEHLGHVHGTRARKVHFA